MSRFIHTRALWIAIGLTACLPAGFAEETPENAIDTSAPVTAETLLARVRASLPKETLLIKGKLMKGERIGRLEQAFLIEALLEWGRTPPSARYTLRDAFGTPLSRLTVIRQAGRAPEFNFEQGQPLRPVPMPDLNSPMEGTEVTWNDLSLSFLWWPNGTMAGRDNICGRDCYVIDLKPPGVPGGPAPATGQSDAVASVRLWIDDHMIVLIQMEETNAEGKLLRRLSVKTFKKVTDLWMIKNMDIRRYPSNHRTQIRIDDVTPITSSNAPDINLNNTQGGNPMTMVNDTVSLQAAIAATRAAGPDTNRRIILSAGQYFLEEEIRLDARDNGLTLEAAPGAEVVLLGGRKITGWEKDGDRFYAAALPGVKERRWDFRALLVNGRLADRARLPKTGKFSHASKFDVNWMSTSAGGWQRKPTTPELTTLKYNPEDLGAGLDINNAELTIYHVWDESMVGLAAHDPDRHVLTFSNPAGHPPGAFGVQDYVVWNVREGLTEPGQWYLDRTNGRLVYWPRAGEDMAQAEIIAPTVETIIKIAGTKEHPVKNIALRGLTLSATTTPAKSGGFGASAYPGAVSAVFAEDCSLSGLQISQVGGHGIKTTDTRRLKIAGCHIHHTGAGGILMPSGQDALIENNHIHHVGVIYPSGIGLQAGNITGARMHHNEIHDTSYTAICSGGSDNTIESNFIYRAMRQLKDGAGIYISGCRNITIRGNFIRDITDQGGRGTAPSAYYLDEKAESCLVEGNVALNVAMPSHNHMARNNMLRNNVFITDAGATLSFPRSDEYGFERNIVCATGKIVLTNPKAISRLNSNLLFSATGQIEGSALEDYTQTKAIALEASNIGIFADPQFASYQNGNITFKPTSPASKLGIKPIDVSSAGLLSKS